MAKSRLESEVERFLLFLGDVEELRREVEDDVREREHRREDPDRERARDQHGLHRLLLEILEGAALACIDVGSGWCERRGV